MSNVIFNIDHVERSPNILFPAQDLARGRIRGRRGAVGRACEHKTPPELSCAASGTSAGDNVDLPSPVSSSDRRLFGSFLDRSSSLLLSLTQHDVSDAQDRARGAVRGRRRGIRRACDKRTVLFRRVSGRQRRSAEPHFSLRSTSFRLILGPVFISARDVTSLNI